jgi:probable HAF family extracellular repeat protein
MNCRNWLVFVLAACGPVLLATAQAQAAPPRYAVTDLGDFYGTYFSRIPINNHGQVAFVSDEGHAVIYSDGVMTDLGTLGGDHVDSVRAINDNGQLACTVLTIGPTSGFGHAVLYSDGTVTDLGTLDGSNSDAADMNNRGQVVGWSGSRAFLYSEGVTTDVGSLYDVGFTYAFGINNGGQIVGNYFFYGDGVMTDLSSLLGCSGSAVDINDSGQFVGTLGIYLGEGQFAYHAFFFSDGATTDLGTLGGTSSEATAINTRGQVVGNLYSSGVPAWAFLYSEGVVYDLRSLAGDLVDWQSIQASDINDQGWITGFGMIDDEVHVFLLTPVPEPSAVLLTAFALLGLLAFARTRRK